MKKAYGYDTYHGRGALRTVLKWLLIILLVGALLMGGAFLFLQQYLVRTEDGAKLVLPFWSDRPAAQTPAMPSPTGDRKSVV